MAKVTIQIPDEVLGLAENPQQVENEVLQAALAFWLARGMVAKKSLKGDLVSHLVKILQAIREKSQSTPQEWSDDSYPAAPVESAAVASLQPGLERLRGKRALHATSKGFADLLLSIPQRGDDSDFERINDLGREPPRWDT